MKCRFQWCIVHTKILSTFHARVEYISVTKYAIETIGPMWANDPKIYPFHLGTWTPSNTWMPGMTQLTTNDSSIAASTSTQLRNKGPIGYNGTPQIHPQNCPSPSTIITPSNKPIPRPTPITIPNGIRIQSANLPQNTLWTDWPKDRQTDRWSRRMFHNMSAPLAMLIESDALIMEQKL